MLIPTAVHDCGYVSPDTVLIASYPFTNPSSDTLYIEYVNPDCSCTGFSLSDSVVPPGGSGEIVLRLNMKGHKGSTIVMAVIKANIPDKFRAIRLVAELR